MNAQLKQTDLLQMLTPVSTADTMTVRMPIDQWLAVPAHPYQRNTEGRLAKAVKSHLGTYSPLHAVVQMVVLQDGTRYKLDGHTRALAWERNLIQRPDSVTVNVFHVKGMEEALALYTQIDSQQAVENAWDRAYGAGHGAGLRNADANHYATSARYGTPARLASAMRRGHTNPIVSIGVYDAVPEHKDAIEALIDLNPNLHIFLVGVQAAFILTYEKHGPQALYFWQQFAQNAGSKMGIESDGIQALHNFILDRRRGAHAGRHNNKDYYVCGVAISCFETYLAGKTYKVTPRMTDPTKYLPLGK